MDERKNRGFVARQIPDWLALVILSPLVAMAVTLWLEDWDFPALLVGLTIATAGSMAGAMLEKGTARVRILRGLLGAAVGVAGVAATFGGAVMMSELAKGL